jgi:predicted transcriptional regulator
MESNLKARHSNYMQLTAHIVSAYVKNNHMPVAEVSKLLSGVHAAVQARAQGGTSSAAGPPVARPTKSEVKRSISRDALISFEDGKRYKALKRHLTTRGLTPERYREKWGLPRDYPMTAASYSEARSALAHSFGLGQQRKKAAPKAAAAGETVSEKPKRAGRPRKAEAAGA